MSDSGPGALIPYMQEDYNIKYAVVYVLHSEIDTTGTNNLSSLIFVTQAVGFIVAAFFTDALLNKLGRSKSLMLAEILLIIGNVMIVCTPPFPVVVLAFAFIGYATAINLALNNVFCSTLANAAVSLSMRKYSCVCQCTSDGRCIDSHALHWFPPISGCVQP